MSPKPRLLFFVDNSLGRLAKWLRLMGFDTVYSMKALDHERSLLAQAGNGRIVLTRSRQITQLLSSGEVLMIQSELPRCQIQQVIHDLQLQLEELRPFTRCVLCNLPLRRLSKADARGRVPDYIYHNHIEFRQCPGCQRIYWPGSHGQRWSNVLTQWFGR